MAFSLSQIPGQTVLLALREVVQMMTMILMLEIRICLMKSWKEMRARSKRW